MKKYFFISCLFISFSSYSQSIAREVVASSGDHFKTSYAELSWTLGEVMVEDFAVNWYGSLSQGFHQEATSTNILFSFFSGFFNETADTISINTDSPISETSTLSAKVFPNPAINIVTLELTGPWNDDVVVEVMDMLGRIVFVENMNASKQAQIDLSFLSNGIYTLQIWSSNLTSKKSIKINKIN